MRRVCHDHIKTGLHQALRNVTILVTDRFHVPLIHLADVGRAIFNRNRRGSDRRRVGAKLLRSGAPRVDELAGDLCAVSVYSLGDAAKIGHIVIACNIKRAKKVNTVRVVDGRRTDRDNAHAALCLILDVSEKLRRHAARWGREAGDHRRELHAVLDLHAAYLYRREDMWIFIE